MNKDELMHYGILGMKWGHHKAKAPNSEDYTRYRELRKKKVSQLSTRELNELNSRMQAEDNYKRNKNNRDPLNRAYKMAVGVGLAITALETTHKALQRVKKSAKPIAVNVYDRIKKLKHSDMDDDYLMHYGVLGMKWRNHIYKIKERKNKRRLQNQVKNILKNDSDYKQHVKKYREINNNLQDKYDKIVEEFENREGPYKKLDLYQFRDKSKDDFYNNNLAESKKCDREMDYIVNKIKRATNTVVKDKKVASNIINSIGNKEIYYRYY